MAALGLLVTLALAVVLVPALAARDPLRIDDVLARRLVPPFSSDAHGAWHLLGTDRFGRDLKKLLPRIPKVKNFRAFSDAGRALSALHLGYETIEPYPLDEQRSVNASYRVEKMKYAKTGRVADKSTVVYNSGITVSGIPEEAHEYMLGSRSAIDWIIERYQVKTDKASGIVNDPNDWAEEQGNPRYILDLLARIVTVSVETVKIVKSLPPLDLVE